MTTLTETTAHPEHLSEFDDDASADAGLSLHAAAYDSVAAPTPADTRTTLEVSGLAMQAVPDVQAAFATRARRFDAFTGQEEKTAAEAAEDQRVERAQSRIAATFAQVSSEADRHKLAASMQKLLSADPANKDTKISYDGSSSSLVMTRPQIPGSDRFFLEEQIRIP